MVEVDARGLECPQPVMLTLDAIKNNPDDVIQVTVSSTIPRDNVAKMATKRGKSVEIAESGSDFVLTLSQLC